MPKQNNNDVSNSSLQSKQQTGEDCLQKTFDADEIGLTPPPVEDNFVPPEEIPIFDPNYAVQEKRKVVLEKQYDISKLSAKQIWGVLLLKLKQGGFVALHTAGGEIRDLEFKNNKLVVKVREDYLFSILTNQKNFENIKNILKQIDASLEIEFVQKKLAEDEFEQNYEKLKILFGDFLQEQ